MTDQDGPKIGGLEGMLRRQQVLQTFFDPRAVSDDPQESCEYIKDMAYALEDEVHELTAETGWKPWSSSWHINEEAAQGEWIDAFHFMLNLANKLHLTAEKIMELYYAKADVNLARITAGYDGVSTKCPQCKRALDDPATPCYLPKDDPNYRPGVSGWNQIPMGYCASGKRYYSE